MTHDELFGRPSLDERRTIAAIAKRAVDLAERENKEVDLMSIEMDITAAHHSCPLKLDELLQADDFNFIHDVFGIRRHLDRTNGKLTDCFLPRFSMPSEEKPTWDMSDAELDAICRDEDHPQQEDACWELDSRREARADSRVAQATGRAQGEQAS